MLKCGIELLLAQDQRIKLLGENAADLGVKKLLLFFHKEKKKIG